jgi:hypothetical protein
MRRLPDPEVPRSPETFDVLEDLRQTVLEAAASQPLQFELEDMHVSARWMTHRRTCAVVAVVDGTALPGRHVAGGMDWSASAAV